MTKEILIQKCLLIIKEIEEWSIKNGTGFYICNYSKVKGAKDKIVPLLSMFGKTYIERFGHIYAFTYEDDSLFNKEYNQAKINHIRSFIAWLEAGNSVEDLFIEEETK